MQSVTAAQLVRKKQVAELLQISISTLCSWLKEGGRYYKPLFPRPTYFEGSRTPFWRLTDIQELIAANGAGPSTSVKPQAVLPAPKARENILQSTSQSNVGKDDLPAAATKPTGLTEFVLKSGLRVQVRTRRRVGNELDAGAPMPTGPASSAHISHSVQN